MRASAKSKSVPGKRRGDFKEGSKKVLNVAAPETADKSENLSTRLHEKGNRHGISVIFDSRGHLTKEVRRKGRGKSEGTTNFSAGKCQRENCLKIWGSR